LIKNSYNIGLETFVLRRKREGSEELHLLYMPGVELVLIVDVLEILMV